MFDFWNALDYSIYMVSDFWECKNCPVMQYYDEYAKDDIPECRKGTLDCGNMLKKVANTEVTLL